jgi:sigma-E factor negative regulatory protein RseA
MEKLSAFVDGEVQDGDVQSQLARIESDAGLRNAWNTYHLIGDALRGNVSPDLTSRVVARLEDEPAMPAPRRKPAGLGRWAWLAMPAAAGIAAVTLVVWTAAPIWQTEPQIASSPIAAGGAASPGPVTAVSLSTPELRTLASGIEVENYLFAHQGYARTSAMQGVVPYARTIADERRGASK